MALHSSQSRAVPGRPGARSNNHNLGPLPNTGDTGTVSGLPDENGVGDKFGLTALAVQPNLRICNRDHLSLVQGDLLNPSVDRLC
jgi:hypothetical protein